MRRWWFFAMERLQIRRGERRVIGILVVILLGVSLFRWIHQSAPAYDRKTYRTFDAALTQRLDSWKTQHNKKLSRYYPEADSLKDTTEVETKERGTVKNIDSPESSRKSTKQQTIDINRASTDQLEKLPGIGPVIADRIKSWRDEHGGYQKISDLRKVKGIGVKRLEKIKPLVIVDSLQVGK